MIRTAAGGGALKGRSAAVPSYEVSEVNYPAGLCVKLHGRDPYLCFLIQGSLTTEHLSEEPYASGDVLYFPSNSAHAIRFAEPARCLLVQLRPELPRRFPGGLDQRGEVLLNPGWEAYSIAKRLQAEFHRGAEVQSGRLLVEALVMQLLTLAARSGRQKEGGREPAWLKKTRTAIDNGFLHIEYGLQQLAVLAGVHPVHLAREFRAHYGITVGQYIRRLRVQHACKLMQQSRMPLKEIAAVCRFADASHFSNQFKKVVGMTPAQYRNTDEGG